MPRYEVTFADGYGREIDRMVVTANSLALALTVSGDVLADAVRDGVRAVSASVELLGTYACEVDESAGMAEAYLAGGVNALPLENREAHLAEVARELHSVRSELHTIDRPDVGRAERLAAELRAELAELDDPSTGRS